MCGDFMGDGVRNKIALIVNGDDEGRHLQNVENAIQFYQNKGFTTQVLSPLAPKFQATQFLPPTTENLESIILDKYLLKELDRNDFKRAIKHLKLTYPEKAAELLQYAQTLYQIIPFGDRRGYDLKETFGYDNFPVDK